jgi:hypothetical protein
MAAKARLNKLRGRLGSTYFNRLAMAEFSHTTKGGHASWRRPAWPLV